MRQKQPEKLAAIYQAALKTVLHEGFAGLKMSEVAKKAGVATGTLYIYFTSKEELVNGLYLELKRRNSARFLAEFDASAPFMEGFEKIWFNYVKTQLDEPEAAAFLEQYYRSPFLKETVRQESDRMLKPIFDLLERGKKERLVKDVPTNLLVVQLSGAIHELVRWTERKQLTADPETLRQAFALAWDSIKR